MNTKRQRYLLVLCAGISTIAYGQSALNPNPSRVIGQISLDVNSLAPNLLEGRELNSPGAVTIDAAASPPILYVSDSGNNRVLAWRNAQAFANGATADKVIGQKDLFSTFPQGPTRGEFSTGLTGPAGLAVDSAGNLYVVDSGNNRILRFPRPFDQSGTPLPDLVIGQPNFNTRGTNQGGISATSIALNSAPWEQDCLHANCYNASITFDKNGNLYFADALNNRVLRYPASVLHPGAFLAADLVLGQANFSTADSTDSANDAAHLEAPAGVAYDPAGRLFVSDGLNRVVVYVAPFGTGMTATRFLGITVQQQNQPPPALVSDSRFNGPEGLFMINGVLGVTDVNNNRVLQFGPYEQWSIDIFTQHARVVVGQADFAARLPNRGGGESGPNTLSSPFGAVFFDNELYIADTLNNRVIVIPMSGGALSATRVLGQSQFNYNTVNRIEGRELHLATTNNQGSFGDAGLIIDKTSNPPHLYVSDPYNNRVLGFRDATTVKTGATADLVMGQPDLFHSGVNAPGGDTNRPTDQGFRLPTGLALDKSGNLYVADSLNGRVLRFPKPFDQDNFPHADLVIGQANFSARITDPTQSTMNLPYGLAFTQDGGLLVSDAALHRVLLFVGPTASFTNGMPAAKVFGQPGFSSSTPGQDDNRMYGPREIATDRSNRLYVADAGNNRISIFDDVTQAGSNPRAVITLKRISQDSPLQNPRGIYLDQATGHFWVAAQNDSDQGVVVRYPNFDSLIVSGFADTVIREVVPIAVTEDTYGNLYVADFANRVVIHYPALAALNGASFLSRAMAPGMIASLFPMSPNNRFGSQTKSFDQLPEPLPLPTELADVQVLVDGKPAPLYYVSPGQINLMVPTSAPTSGAAEFEVVRPSTGQILGSYLLPMNVASPGLFLRGGTQIAALNEDNTVNSPANPAKTGSVIQIFATGQGIVPNAPPDGQPATGQTTTPTKPRVVINPASGFVPDGDILYSGLAPGLVGVWQINVRIPKSVPPGNAVPIFVIYRDIPSIATGQLSTSVAVRQP